MSDEEKFGHYLPEPTKEFYEALMLELAAQWDEEEEYKALLRNLGL